MRATGASGVVPQMTTGDRVRLEILYLVAHGASGTTDGELAQLTGETRGRVCHAIEDLVTKGLVRSEQSGLVLTDRGEQVCRKLGLLPHQTANVSAPREVEHQQDPAEYLPDTFQRGGADWLGAAEDGESPSGG
jgi:hypothetical protein